MSKKSKILVIIQFSCFAFFAIAGNLFAYSYWLTLQFIGLSIGLWGILAMKIGNFNVQPEVKSHANMVSSGPYRFVRNPMYTGLILFFGISVFVNFNINEWISIVRIIIFSALTIVFILKINMEEQFLEIKFGNEYVSYKKRTYRLIPYVY